MESWPVNCYCWVVVGKTAFVVWMVNVVAFVTELSDVAEHKEAVRESAWDEELALVFGRENGAFPLAESGAVRTKVDRHVKNFA